MFPARRYSATDRKSTSNNSSCTRFGEKLHSTTLHRHTYGIPSDESSRHFHNIELDARRRRASYVQANNSPSMPFKGCLPSGASYCSDRDMQHALASTESVALECAYFFRERRIELSASNVALRIEPFLHVTRHIVSLLL